MAHGVDRQAGGFFTCLERDGQAFATDKAVWFVGRATWLYATLYRLVEPRPEWLELARHGYDFMIRHCFDDVGKMYFLVDRTGQPLRMRRYYFSEIFAALACAALAQVDDDPEIAQRARDLLATLDHVMHTPGVVEPKTNPDTRPMRSLSPAMCMLNVADALHDMEPEPRYDMMVSAAIDDVFRHFVRHDERLVLETVAPDGSFLDTLEGRTMNPGHAIETAWFILEVARRRRDTALIGRAVQIIDFSIERGWDHDDGGLFYFVDARNKPSPFIEHDMKLWWVHCEALYAALLAHHLTGEQRFADLFEKVHDYTFSHFPDREYGEWFGYLRRDGSPSTTLKGNLWKGPFHVPRALLLCWKLLDEMAA